MGGWVQEDGVEYINELEFGEEGFCEKGDQGAGFGEDHEEGRPGGERVV